MQCSKNEFFSIIDPWRGKLCFVIAVSDRVHLQFWARLETIWTNGELRFSGRVSESLDIDLSGADFFEFGDSRLAPKAIRDSFDALFESAACARVTGSQLFSIFLGRKSDG